MRRSVRSFAPWTLALAIAFASTAHAAPAAPTCRPGAFGMVYVNPATGFSDAATIGRFAPRVEPGAFVHPAYETRRGADGSLTVITRGLLREHSYVRLGRDGRIHFGCLDDLAGVHRALDAPAPAVMEDR